MMIFTYFLGALNLVKNTFNLGYCRCPDEVKVEILMALKAFAITFTVLHYGRSDSFLDFTIE